MASITIDKGHEAYGPFEVLPGVSADVSERKWCSSAVSVRKIDAANYPGHENMTCGTVGMGGRVANDVPRKVARHLHCVPELCTLSVYVGG
ncbi:hypothetical protein [Mesorhizobium sp. LNHC221B00]|uniref:hypothetical protein n=1 Tax=Mesorhizobium sp. LNHC221B00 TaxID=1287233 RepID=UPI0012EC21F3|nr:hypothetical protein [Mesorhizobium sp. LNHC221B00]